VRVGAGLRRLVLGLTLLSTACAGGGNPSPAPSDLPFAPGGTLRLTLFSWSDHEFDSRTDDGKGEYAIPSRSPTTSRGSSCGCCLVRTLMSYKGTSTAEGGSIPRPDLAAADPRVSADGLTWIFQLKSGIHYAPPLQKVEVTARDFIRGLERGLSPSFIPVSDVATGFAPINRGFDYLYLIIEGAEEFLQGDADTICGLEAPNSRTLVIH
jgi:ABC-type transport system substrate-binding protein